MKAMFTMHHSDNESNVMFIMLSKFHPTPNSLKVVGRYIYIHAYIYVPHLPPLLYSFPIHNTYIFQDRQEKKQNKRTSLPIFDGAVGMQDVDDARGFRRRRSRIFRDFSSKSHEDIFLNKGVSNAKGKVYVS